MSTMTIEDQVTCYPKIDTLFERDPQTFKVTSQLRHPEFAAVDSWLVTEKIHGANIRIAVTPDRRILFGGRTDDAQLPPHLSRYLEQTFTRERIDAAILEGEETVVLFGEGYGPKVQKGGGNYRADVSFRLFDVLVGRWWLTWGGVQDVASKLGIETVPSFGVMSRADAMKLVSQPSIVAQQDGGPGCTHEGIVARSEPLLLMRDGSRLVWKLKGKDFPEAK